MKKKDYSKPEINVLSLENNCAMLAGSGSAEGLPGTETDYGDGV